MTSSILLATDANNPQVVGAYNFTATAEEKGKQLPKPSGYRILCAIPEAEKEFEDSDYYAYQIDGDVKYHMGFSSDVSTPGGPCHLTLAFNPSHLEIVNPVVEGSVYARQVRRGAEGKAKVLPVVIHGDSAVAGQG